MSDPAILSEAKFNPRVCTYWLLSGGVIMLIAVVTIPLIPFWFYFGRKLTLKYLEHIGCTLTTKTLVVKKGWINTIEKTIPLEKITDLALKQGPIMRYLDLHALSVETAGSSGAGGALVSLVGIEDTLDFRNAVLAQRDVLSAAEHRLHETTSTLTTAVPSEGDPAVLADIRDSLHRIEELMQPDASAGQ